jgi:hypothetical protein
VPAAAWLGPILSNPAGRAASQFADRVANWLAIAFILHLANASEKPTLDYANTINILQITTVVLRNYQVMLDLEAIIICLIEYALSYAGNNYLLQGL